MDNFAGLALVLSIASVACSDAGSVEQVGTGKTASEAGRAGTGGTSSSTGSGGSSASAGGGTGGGGAQGGSDAGAGGNGGTRSDGGASIGADSGGGGSAAGTATGPAGGAGTGTTWVIHCGNFYSKPNDLTIKVGDTVTWVRDEGEHFIVSAAVSGGAAAQCAQPTSEFFALSPAPCPAQTDGLGHSCAGCPSGYQAGAFCVGAHNMPFSHAFTLAGTFGYVDTRNTHCLSGIKGVIKVE